MRRLLVAALNPPGPGTTMLNDECWPREIYDDYLIYHRDGKTYRVSYTIDEDDVVTLGEPKPVKEVTTYEPISESVDGRGLPLIESLDEDGYLWKVQVIRAGVSLNNNEYPLTTLHEAVPAYDGVSVFPEHDKRNRTFNQRLGFIVDPKPNSFGIEGTFEIDRGKPEVRESIRHAWDVQRRTGKPTIGFSHTIDAGGFKAKRRQPRGWTVESISRVASVDLVMEPAAGGALLGPVSESQQAHTWVPDTLKEAIVDHEKMLGTLRAGEALPDSDMAALIEAVGWTEVSAAIAEGKADEPPTKLAKTVKDNAKPAEGSISESVEARLEEAARKAEERLALAEAKATLTEALTECSLPAAFKDAIREDFSGVVFEPEALTKRIERDTKLYEASLPKGVKPSLVSGNTEPGEDQQDKWQKAMDGLFEGKAIDGVTPFRTLKEAYLAITGKSYSYIDGSLPRAVLGEAIAYAGDDTVLQESITSSTFGQVLGDSITRRMIREYMLPDRQTWRAIADIVPVNDFRTQRRVRWGGYGLLDVVSEGAPYPELTSPGDEEATDSLDKYGGLEQLTMEMIANDDMGVVRRIPVKLGQAAIDTIYDAVWLDTIEGNATASYDSTALYHTNHANTDTDALDEAGLLAAENAMRAQAEYGNQSGLKLGAANTPRIMVVPDGLRITASKLVNSPVAVTSAEDASTPNFFQGRYQIIAVPEFTDQTDWYLFADPARVPALEVGFWQGRDTPELFVQDAQTVGSVFTADKITYKVRHIFYVMIVDHRATYRNVAS